MSMYMITIHQRYIRSDRRHAIAIPCYAHTSSRSKN